MIGHNTWGSFIEQNSQDAKTSQKLIGLLCSPQFSIRKVCTMGFADTFEFDEANYARRHKSLSLQDLRNPTTLPCPEEARIDSG